MARNLSYENRRAGKRSAMVLDELIMNKLIAVPDGLNSSAHKEKSVCICIRASAVPWAGDISIGLPPFWQHVIKESIAAVSVLYSCEIVVH